MWTDLRVTMEWCEPEERCSYISLNSSSWSKQEPLSVVALGLQVNKHTSKKCFCLLSAEVTNGRDHPFISFWQWMRGIKGWHWPEITHEPRHAIAGTLVTLVWHWGAVLMCVGCVLYKDLLLEMKQALYTQQFRVLSQGMSTTGVLALFAVWTANKLVVSFMRSSKKENISLSFIRSNVQERFNFFTDMLTVFCF